MAVCEDLIPTLKSHPIKVPSDLITDNSNIMVKETMLFLNESRSIIKGGITAAYNY